MKEIEEMIAIMEAAKEGKKIQIRDVGSFDWFDIDTLPIWNWREYDYRVKPEPKVRPYENAKEFLDAMKEHGPFITRDDEVYKMALTVFDDRANYETTFVEYEYLIELGYKWQDGTPCGVEEG